VRERVSAVTAPHPLPPLGREDPRLVVELAPPPFSPTKKLVIGQKAVKTAVPRKAEVVVSPSQKKQTSRC